MLRLTRAGDYAVRAVLYLATRPAGEIVDRQSVSQAQDIPTSFLSKILQRLTATGIIRSFKGSAGGFALDRPAEEITLLDVVMAVEGPLALNQCLLGGNHCQRSTFCPVHPVWIKAQNVLEEALSSVNFKDLAEHNRESPFEVVD